jgi:two-component sensor histidine kinase
MNTFALLSLISFLVYVQVSVWVLIRDSRQRTHRIFSLLSFLFSVYALGNFMYFSSQNIDEVYFFDRIASVSWTFFPLVSVWFFLELTRSKSRVIKAIFYFFQLPTALYVFFIAQTQLENAKFFYQLDGIWYYTPNEELPVYYLFVLYLISTVLVVFFMLIRWYFESTLNKHKLQAKVLLVTLVGFFSISFLTNIILPYLGSQITPGLLTTTALILVGGGTYTLVYLSGKVLSSDLIYKLLLNHIKEFLFFLDKNGMIYATNSFTLANLHYNNYDLLKGEPTFVFSSYDKVKELLSGMKDRKISSQLRVDLITREGRKIPVMLTVIKITGAYDSVHGYVLACVDYRQKLKLKEEVAERVRTEKNLYQIRRELEFLVKKRTSELQDANQKLQYEVMERKRAEQQIKADLDEKVELVKEVHHRVKNNIQMIISLINMLCSHPKINQHASEKLREIAEKVRYISRIHEDFYSSPNLSNIAFSKYLKKAIGELYSNYGNGQNLIFKLNISNENLEIDQAIPLGIIFNELMLNVFRFAFNGENVPDKKKTVNIEFYRKNEKFSLIVSDNGKGLPENVEEIKYNRIGLQLIEILAKEHLKGEVDNYGSFGTTFKISFTSQSI